MSAPINPTTVHKPLGMYSHTMRIPPDADWLVIAGGNPKVSQGSSLSSKLIRIP